MTVSFYPCTCIEETVTDGLSMNEDVINELALSRLGYSVLCASLPDRALFPALTVLIVSQSSR